MVFEGAVLNIALCEFGESVDFVVLIELKLTSFDLAFDILSPVVGFFLALEMVADSGVAFDADGCAPDGGSVVVFAFVNRCHSSNLWFGCLVGWRRRLSLFFVAPSLHREHQI